MNRKVHPVRTTNAHLFPIDKAQAAIEKLNRDPNDDWTYRVVGCPGADVCRIEVLDADGQNLGWL